jgi:hypothetical protein
MRHNILWTLLYTVSLPPGVFLLQPLSPYGQGYLLVFPHVWVLTQKIWVFPYGSPEGFLIQSSKMLRFYLQAFSMDSFRRGRVCYPACWRATHTSQSWTGALKAVLVSPD